MNKKELFIFDMDGVLLDSEPYWREAQIDVLSQYGAIISTKDCIRYTMGKRIDDISILWIEMFALKVTHQHLANLILNKTAELINQNAEAKKGIYQLINYLKQNHYRLALATSSSTQIITAVLHKLDITNIFEIALSADEVKKGKPSPDVYLEVCNRLNVSGNHAIALEDSLTGVRSAIAANITTIALPERIDDNFEIADFIAETVEDVIDIISSNF